MFYRFCCQHIPMPVLYGLFLYMGVSALKGLQVRNVFVTVVNQSLCELYAYKIARNICTICIFTMTNSNTCCIHALIHEISEI